MTIYMKLTQKDPSCPDCYCNTTIELIAGTPCVIKVHVTLAPPPTGHSFPTPGVETAVTYAALKYSDDDGNTVTKELGYPTGPAYSSWDAGSSFDVTFDAAAWLTSGDFGGTSARMEIRTNKPRTVYQWWVGIV